MYNCVFNQGLSAQGKTNDVLKIKQKQARNNGNVVIWIRSTLLKFKIL